MSIKTWQLKTYGMQLSEVKFTQLCLTLCDPMDCIVNGILQARILEWVAFPFSRGSSQPKDQTQVFWIAGGFFTSWAIREAPRDVVKALLKGKFIAIQAHLKIQGKKSSKQPNLTHKAT